MPFASYQMRLARWRCALFCLKLVCLTGLPQLRHRWLPCPFVYDICSEAVAANITPNSYCRGKSYSILSHVASTHVYVPLHIHHSSSLQNYHIYTTIYIYVSEVGGLRPNGKSLRFVRACAQLYVRSEWISKLIISPLFSYEIKCSISLR